MNIKRFILSCNINKNVLIINILIKFNDFEFVVYVFFKFGHSGLRQWWAHCVSGCYEQERIVFNWNHFEMRLLNLRINFYLLQTFCPHLGSFCVVSSFTTFGPNFPLRPSSGDLPRPRRQHPTKQQLYGHLPPITKTIKIRETRHAGHFWRCRDKLISDVLQ